MGREGTVWGRGSGMCAGLDTACALHLSRRGDGARAGPQACTSAVTPGACLSLSFHMLFDPKNHSNKKNFCSAFQSRLKGKRNSIIITLRMPHTEIQAIQREA